MDNTVLLDSGFTKAGVRWEIRRYKLRNASIHCVRVNGQEIMTKDDGSEGGRPMTRKDCYEYLQDAGVQAFSKRFLDDGKEMYTPIVEREENERPDTTNDGGAGGS